MMTRQDTTADPLLAGIRCLAERFGFGVATDLFDYLPRNEEGFLPLHQADHALELAGLSGEEHRLSRLPKRAEYYPALAIFQDDSVAAILEVDGGQYLVGTAGDAEPVWKNGEDISGAKVRSFVTVVGNPDTLRGDSAPWHANRKGHWFWSELRKARGSMVSPLLASLLINALALALPLFMMNVYDRVIPNEAEASLWVLGIGVALAFILEFVLRIARTNVVDELGRRLDLRLSEKIFSRVLSIPLRDKKGSTGAQTARVSEYSLVRDFFASTTVLLAVDLTFVVLFVFVIAYLAGWLALVPIIAVAAMIIAGYVLQREVVEAVRNAQTDNGLQQTLLMEAISGMETLKSIAGERVILGRWRGLAEMSAASQLRLRQINARAVTLASTFQQFSSVSLIIGGYYLFVSGQISMGAIIAIVMLATRSLAPAGQIAFLLTRGRQAKEALGSLDKLFNSDDERRKGHLSFSGDEAGYTINVEGLGFTYPDTTVPALERIDLTIAPGERIAIIGRVASGKSTLGRLLCGLYEPTEGAILINNLDSRQFNTGSLRRVFRFVGQDADLFTGSIKDNLTLGKTGASNAELVEALGKIGADQFISRGASGFERPVGDQGRMLSGGQRAFLSLSRAIVSDFRLLFLDEPTGAMDSRSETLFCERLADVLSPDQTLLISTHRSALFALCNRIIVIDQGRIVADGAKEDILRQVRNTSGGGLT